jgi:hypothetical protein
MVDDKPSWRLYVKQNSLFSHQDVAIIEILLTKGEFDCTLAGSGWLLALAGSDWRCIYISIVYIN